MKNMSTKDGCRNETEFCNENGKIYFVHTKRLTGQENIV